MRRPGLRLTRRGRLVVLVLTAVLLLGAGWLLPQAGVGAASERDARPAVGYVVVQPGETLWDVAGRVAPDADRRDTIERILAMNKLRDAGVGAFQRLAVPAP